MKRHQSPDAVGEGSSRSKKSKTSSESTATGAETEQLSDKPGKLHISVALRSASKALRNDPKPALTDEEWQRNLRTRLDTSLGDFSSSQVIRDTENPRGPDPTGSVSAAADLGLANGQHSPQHCSPVGSAPTANFGHASGEGSLDKSNKDDNSDFDGGHSHQSDDNQDSYGSEGLNDSCDDDSDEEFPWYEEIDGLATLNPSTDIATVSRRAARRAARRIGSCNAKLIRRNMMRESFWQEMEAPTQETHDLAFDLFDRYGRLNPEFYEHEINKGSGVWGNELDHGDLLLFEEINVDPVDRRSGIGTKLVNAIMEKTRTKVSERAGVFALARPGVLWSEISTSRDDPASSREAAKDAMEAALGFWHAMGFRRVGTSSWLAWTDSPGHPSRQLGNAQEGVLPDDQIVDASVSAEIKQAFQKLEVPALEAAECIEELTKAFPEDFEDGQWQTIDPDGNSLLHIASMSSQPELVSFLLSSVPRLMTMRNKKGHTPLEALQSQLERQRTRRSIGHMSLVTSDAFNGFSASSIACLAVSENTAVSDLSSLSPQEIEAVWSATDEQIRTAPQLDIAGIRKTLRYKYNCTCGQCIGGFISPRMKLALLCVAEVEHDNMQTFMDDNGPDWVTFHDDLMKHLPGSVQENLKTDKSMREGFANMFSHFAKCLEQGRMPSEGEVLDFYLSCVGEWPPVTRNYLQRGGSVAAVANMIFEMAMERDEWAGDGSHREIFGENIDKLVVCRNDHEFGFVAGMCGYKRVMPGSGCLF